VRPTYLKTFTFLFGEDAMNESDQTVDNANGTAPANSQIPVAQLFPPPPVAKLVESPKQDDQDHIPWFLAPVWYALVALDFNFERRYTPIIVRVWWVALFAVGLATFLVATFGWGPTTFGIVNGLTFGLSPMAPLLQGGYFLSAPLLAPESIAQAVAGQAEITDWQGWLAITFLRLLLLVAFYSVVRVVCEFFLRRKAV
jgi:hypothetical protein